MQLTPEQAAIAASAGRVVRVTAYAGTGKTSSLIAWAEAHPGRRALYVAFNKSVQLEAQSRFPRWVTARTGHALAFRTVGAGYRDKLVGGIKPWELVHARVLSRTPRGTEAVWADIVWRTVVRFLSSADAAIGAQHVPLTPEDWQGPYAWADPARVVRDAERVWRRMQDPGDKTVGMVHDGYLKLYVLQSPRLAYDTILFDEAQDANPVILQLITQQRQAQQIYVGDPLQAIYAWRGAVDAMSQLQPDQDLRLTASFRFGPRIAAWATRMLRWFDTRLPPLTGMAPTPGQVYRGVGSPPVTLLARSNARLFSEAVAILDRQPTVQFHWVGGIDGYRLDLLEDAYQLSQGAPVRSPFLQLFPDFDTLVDYAENVEDVEWQSRCRAVERWGRRLPSMLGRVRAASQNPDQATVHFATIHKAKGLEWPHVVILDDMAELTPDLTPEDQHLWYVAMTRATEQLGLPEAAVERLQSPARASP